MPPLVSAFLLVRDEADTLDRALASLKGLADEVVVGIDPASADSSEAIARDRGARIVRIDLSGALGGDFAAAHSLLDREGRGIWGFKLDGHEYLEPGHAARLRGLIEGSPAAVGALAVVLRMSESEGGHRALVTRGYRRGPKVRYVRPIHEQISGMSGCVLPCTDVVIQHHRSEARIAARAGQRNTRDIALLRAELERDPTDCITLYYLAERELDTGRSREARDLSAQALTHLPPGRDALMWEVRMVGARATFAAGDLSAARVQVADLLRLQWMLPDAWCLLGEIETAAGRLDAAASAFRCAAAVPFVPWEFATQVRTCTWLPRQRLAHLAAARGDREEARRWASEALASGAPVDARNALLVYLS